MENYYLKNDESLDIKFKGRIIAGSHNCYDETFVMYETAKGATVCEKVTLNDKCEFTRKAAICCLPNEIIDFFGYSQLAKNLYEQASIRHWIET